jgi:flagellar motor switch protein FliG
MTVKDQVFLYCFLLYEGQDQQILSLLSDERAKLIQKEARRYDRFPKEVRMTLVSKLLGYLVQHVRNRNLERVHPSWIAEFLEKESPYVATIILNRFSPEFRRQVQESFITTRNLPASIVAAQTSDAIFQIFSMKFAPMSAPWGESQLTLQTLYLLKQEEMMTYLKHSGVREIARASSVAGKNALAALVRRFPPELQEDFLNGIKSAAGEGGEKQKLAAKRLAQIDLTSMSMEEATLKVGTTKVGAALKNDRPTATKIAQRLPRSLGVILLQATDEMEAAADEAQELLTILKDLIEKEKIDRQQVDSLFSSVARARPSGIT